MWKERPSSPAPGGIVDQIDDGMHGLLVADPADLPAFGTAVEALPATPPKQRNSATMP